MIIENTIGNRKYLQNRLRFETDINSNYNQLELRPKLEIELN